MGKQKAPVELDYYEQQKQNEFAFKEMLKSVRPELFVLMDILDQTSINPLVVWKVIRQLNNIALGTGYGQVVVQIENGKCTFIRGEDSDKVNEVLIRKEEQ
jgi:hypothetical protein